VLDPLGVPAARMVVSIVVVVHDNEFAYCTDRCRFEGP
jgi:hypothetical protein